MSTKTFCDCCNSQISEINKIDSDSFRLSGKVIGIGNKTLSVEVITAKSDTWNSGDYCKYCVLDALYEQDDRVKDGTAKEPL